MYVNRGFMPTSSKAFRGPLKSSVKCRQKHQRNHQISSMLGLEVDVEKKTTNSEQVITVFIVGCLCLCASWHSLKVSVLMTGF